MSLFRSSFIFSLGTALSRIVGLLREVVLANVFGAGVAMDAFLVANRIPNMLRELLAEGALGSSFTKVYSASYENDKKRASELYQVALFCVLGIGAFVSFLGCLYAPWLVSALTLFNGDAKTELFSESVKLTRILFPFIAFMALGSIATGVLHQQGKFFLTSSSSILLNLGYILGALGSVAVLGSFYQPNAFLPEDPQIFVLALGVLFGGFLQSFVQIAGAYYRLGLWPKITFAAFKRCKSMLKSVLLLMLPMVIASGAGQINVFVSTNFATTLENGAVTWLSFAFRLVQLPIGIFAVAISSVILPSLTRALHDSKGEPTDESSKLLFSGVKIVTFATGSFLVFYATSSVEICHLLYEHGKFTSFDTQMTAKALSAYSIGLLGYGLIKVLTSYYYAAGRTKFAMYASLLGIAVNFFANLIFVKALGFEGIALTSSLVLLINAVILFLGLGSGVDYSKAKMLQFALAVLLAIGGVFLLDHYILSLLTNWQSHFDAKLFSLLKITFNGIAVVLSFALFYRLLVGPFPVLAKRKRK